MTPVNEQWANLSQLRSPPKGLVDRLRYAAQLYPCDLLFVHRDAEGADPGERYAEIGIAVDQAFPQSGKPHICVVPIRMTEAWLLIEEAAIRCAVGNPHGTAPLNLPALRKIESIPDPKAVLMDALKLASGYRGRRLKRLESRPLRRLVVENVTNYAILRRLAAFRRLETDVQAFAAEWQRNHP